jgi:diguanylate cyclase (GGDEF)-like protein
VIAVWVAYRIGKRSRDRHEAAVEGGGGEVAKQVVQDLECVAEQVRRSLLKHHASIVQFKERIGALSEEGNAGSWDKLSQEAEEILKPTLHLASQIAHAYDDIRQQTTQLSNPVQMRTDPLTGLSSRRSMEDIMKMLFAMKCRYNTRFSIALIDIDSFQRINAEHGQVRGDQLLRSFAELLEDVVRETDVVVRFGGEEFVVIMPETDLYGAGVFAQRFRETSNTKLSLPTSIGIAEANDDDTIQLLVSRADSALYSAKTTDGNCVYQHTGRHIEPVLAQPSGAAAVTSGDPTRLEVERNSPILA